MLTTTQATPGLFTLTAQTGADHALVEALHDVPFTAIHVTSFVRTGPFTTGVNLVVDKNSPQTLEAQSARQLLRAVRELFRLGLGENALHSHIGLDTANPQTQEQLALFLQQLQIVVQTLAVAVGQPERVGQAVVSTHGNPLGNEKADSAQGGAA